MPTPEETELNKLRKLPDNKACANCDNVSKFGHQNVVEKTHTFVCSNCKSAHQSFSMRVKSVTMSNWSMEEVNALKGKNGGGNAAARKIWLASWSSKTMKKPTSDDKLVYFKEFVKAVYLDKIFYSEASSFSSEESFTPDWYEASFTDSAPSSNENHSADLLGFSPPSKPTTTAAAPSSSDSSDFGFFSEPLKPVAVAATTTTSNTFDPFNMEGVSSAVPAASSSSASTTNTTSSSSSWDPFGDNASKSSVSSSDQDWGAFESAPAPAASSDPFATLDFRPTNAGMTSFSSQPNNAPMMMGSASMPPPAVNHQQQWNNTISPMVNRSNASADRIGNMMPTQAPPPMMMMGGGNYNNTQRGMSSSSSSSNWQNVNAPQQYQQQQQQNRHTGSKLDSLDPFAGM